MFKLGGSSSYKAGIRFMRLHRHMAPSRASPVTPPNHVKFRRAVHTATALNGELKDVHSKRIVKNLLRNDALYEYIMNTTVYPREHECLRELRIITQEHALGFMASTPDQALLLSMLLKVMGAKNTIEVGVFTGCSTLAAALAIPDDGKVLAVDAYREYFDLGLPVIERAGVAHKVDFLEGPAAAVLGELLADVRNEGRFDFAFVDADKLGYGVYHDQLLRLVRLGGVIAYDNTLFHGAVAAETSSSSPPLKEGDKEIRDFMRSFNTRIAADPRIEVVQLPVADGVTLCRRVV